MDRQMGSKEILWMYDMGLYEALMILSGVKKNIVINDLNDLLVKVAVPHLKYIA